MLEDISEGSKQPEGGCKSHMSLGLKALGTLSGLGSF